MRYLIAVMTGVVVAFGLIIGLDMLGHMLYPEFVVDPSMPRIVVAAVIAGLPLGAKLWVMGTWIVAAFVGGWLAARVGRDRTFWIAGIVGALVLAATAANLMMIPHPRWMAIAGLLGIVAATWLAGRPRTMPPTDKAAT